MLFSFLSTEYGNSPCSDTFPAVWRSRRFFFSFSVSHSPSVVTTQSAAAVTERAPELLNTFVQVGNRRDIEQLKDRIQVTLIPSGKRFSFFYL